VNFIFVLPLENYAADTLLDSSVLGVWNRVDYGWIGALINTPIIILDFELQYSTRTTVTYIREL
jgi:hypothetical protein